MAIPTFNKFSDAMVTRQWEGRDSRLSPLGLEFVVQESDINGEIYDYLMEKLHFNSFVEATLNKEPQNEFDKIHLERLKEDCKGAKPKITIKIELEKYE